MQNKANNFWVFYHKNCEMVIKRDCIAYVAKNIDCDWFEIGFENGKEEYTVRSEFTANPSFEEVMEWLNYDMEAQDAKQGE